MLAASGVIGGALGCEESSPEPGGGGPVARLEITPRGLLLTAAGQERRLSVRAYDAKGRVVPAPAYLIEVGARPSLGAPAAVLGLVALLVCAAQASLLVSQLRRRPPAAS